MSTPAPTPTPMTPAAKPPRRSFKSWLLGSFVGAIVLIVIYTLFMLWWSYSEGERAGVLQKFSKRGWICKTYEGELAMYVVGGVAPQIWNFSVRDEAVVEQLHKAVGQQVRLHYAEHRGLPTSCFGETDYFVERVEIVGPPPYNITAPAAGTAAPAGVPSPVPAPADAPPSNP
ncbi:MAG: hypothetical protein MUE61_21185 [Vicinamibacterales bacterium]|jgi:hypothetical protein|nr:hypothetical protein [Vicinamibacterales bacterium]